MSQKLQHQINELILAIEQSKESRNNDTKSSAGDKHETGRAQVQIEIDKLEVQLNKALQTQQEIILTKDANVKDQVGLGSLVFTNQGNYFISIGLGKIEMNHEVYFAISPASPIGKLLMHKKAGAQVQFNGKDIIIERIL